MWILGHDILGIGVLARPISMLILRKGILIVLAMLGIAECLQTMLLLLGVLILPCWMLSGPSDVDVSPAHRSLVAILSLVLAPVDFLQKWSRCLFLGNLVDVWRPQAPFRRENL